jgi:hypothetical protein
LESPSFHVAQVNIARPKAPVDSPLLADFKALLDPVNAIADEARGFVWRLQDESGNATALRIFDDALMVNMSVWESIEALWDFVHAGDHLAVMRRRREWFERMEHFMCLWWVPAGHVPEIAEAEERLRLLRQHGPTERAFTFKQRFAPPAAQAASLT